MFWRRKPANTISSLLVNESCVEGEFQGEVESLAAIIIRIAVFYD
jgi:hypothetical protein